MIDRPVPQIKQPLFGGRRARSRRRSHREHQPSRRARQCRAWKVCTGILYVNAGTTGAEIHLPFGGTKATGNGHREAGTAAFDFFKEWQRIYVDYSGKLQRAQIDNQ